MSSFKDKVVLVTGGASGIGFLMGKKALKKGAKHLIIWDINSELMNNASLSLERDGFSVSTQCVDVSNPVNVDEAAREVLSKHRKIDILFNNAGIIVGKPFHKHSSEDIARTIGVNQLALMFVTNAFLPGMMESNSGHIVAITSSAGLTPNPGMVVYVSSKWGAVGWVESLRLELKKTHPGIKFTNVMPGYIGTNMFTGVTPPRLMPLLDPERITDKIIQCIERNKTTLKAPSLVKITTLARGLLPQAGTILSLPEFLKSIHQWIHSRDMPMTDYAKILEDQKDYFKSGYTKPIQFRVDQLKILKRLLKENEQVLIDAVYKDFRKSPFETFGTEIGLILNEINYALKNIYRWVKPKSVPTALVNFPSKNYILKEPYGSVLIISPWNYPVQLCLLPLVGALAAGNTAIIKPSELTPHTSAVIHKLIAQYFKPGVVTTVLGGVEESQALLNLNFNYIFFTGSTKVGKIIMESASKRLIPVTLELGGKSPCIVDETANLEISAKRIVWGKFVNAGQTCVAPDYLLVQESIKDQLLEELKAAVISLYGDDPSISQDFPRIINDSHFNRLSGYLDNEKTVIGGDSDSSSRYISPTILSDITWVDPIMEDEIFGPILPVLTFKDIDDAVHQALKTPRPLALYIFTNSSETERKVLEQVPFGGGAINDTIAQFGNHHLSFGGVGASGFGSYHGKASFDSFSHQKSIMKKNFLLDIPIRYAPYDGKIKWLKTIFR